MFHIFLQPFGFCLQMASDSGGRPAFRRLSAKTEDVSKFHDAGKISLPKDLADNFKSNNTLVKVSSSGRSTSKMNEDLIGLLPNVEAEQCPSINQIKAFLKALDDYNLGFLLSNIRKRGDKDIHLAGEAKNN